MFLTMDTSKKGKEKIFDNRIYIGYLYQIIYFTGALITIFPGKQKNGGSGCDQKGFFPEFIFPNHGFSCISQLKEGHG